MDIKRIVELSKVVAQAEKVLEVAKADLEATVRASAGPGSNTVTEVMRDAGHTKVVQYRYKVRAEPVKAAPPKSAPERVTAALSSKPQRAKDIAKASGVSSDYLPQVLRALVRDKVAVKVGRGLYRLRGAAK